MVKVAPFLSTILLSGPASLTPTHPSGRDALHECGEIALLVAADYKFGTYVMPDALALIDSVVELRHIDLRASGDDERRRAFADIASDATVVLCAPWGGQGLESVPNWLAEAPEVRLFAGTFDHRFEAIAGVPFAQAAARGLVVVDTSRSMTPAVAEHCLAMILNLLRGIPEGVALVRAGEWTTSWLEETIFVSGELSRRTVGLAGYGVINRSLRRLLAPFSCLVLAHDPHVDDRTMLDDDVTPISSLAELARSSEIFIVGIPQTAATVGVINREVIASLPAGSLFILATRMSVVDQEALWERTGRSELRAAVDVFDPEPPPPEAPFLRDPNVLPTPHMAGNIATVHRRCFRLACEEVVSFLAGRSLRYEMTARDAAIYGGYKDASSVG